MQFGREDKVPQFKLTIVQYAILGIFLVLGYGLWRLQVIGSDKYETMAEHNRIRTVPILAPRGKILDREGRIIVDNYPSFSLLLLRDQVKNLDADIDKIAAGLNLSPKEIRDRVRRVQFAPGYEPIILKDDITPDELAFIESHKIELPELETIMVHRRLYPKNGFMAHVIGYVGEVSEQMLNSPRYELYEPGMVVGQFGLEQQYNDLLIGKDGERRVVVNSRGKEVDRLSETPAVPGKQLKLTIDLDLQIAAEQALGDRTGAIVAMDPHTGEILAMVSRPTFDPNKFAVRITGKEWSDLVNDKNHPLMNKAIQAQLAPGSTFKIIMSVAGLQEGVAQTLHVNCPGYGVFYGRKFNCWIGSEKHSSHGAVDISKGIYQSCDVFFYTLGERLGIGKIAKWASALGIGRKTGVDLPGEASGVMPSEEWKAKNFKQKWYAGETISVAIGQGAVAVTPIQLMRALSGIAMDGQLRRPHLVFEDEVPEPMLRQVNATYAEQVTVPIDQDNWETITEAMSKVPSPLGTAAAAAIPGVDFAGKTGSAQTMSNDAARKMGLKHTIGDNGWFVGFEPRRNPDVVVCVLFEGGEAGPLAARIAAQVVYSYSEKKRAMHTQQKSADLNPVPPAPQKPVTKPAARPLAAGEMTGVWSNGDELKTGRFKLSKMPAIVVPLAAAPGLDAIRKHSNWQLATGN
jgi:penicillin-binding protein 2